MNQFQKSISERDSVVRSFCSHVSFGGYCDRKLNDGALPLDGHPRLDCLADPNRQHPPAHDEGRTILFVIDRLAFKSAAGF